VAVIASRFSKLTEADFSLEDVMRAYFYIIYLVNLASCTSVTLELERHDREGGGYQHCQ
jgi:hypothetical protein